MEKVDDRSWLVTPDMLTHLVTLDDYLAEQWTPIARRSADPAEAIRLLVAAKKPPLEALAGPGDEWWAWVAGSEPLMQSGGLALVRSGAVVWAREDWIS